MLPAFSPVRLGDIGQVKMDLGSLYAAMRLCYDACHAPQAQLSIGACGILILPPGGEKDQ